MGLWRVFFGAFIFLAYVLVVVASTFWIYLCSALRLLLPKARWRQWAARMARQSVLIFYRGSHWILRDGLGMPVRIHAHQSVWERLRTDQSYLLISNHQSWVDIPLIFEAVAPHTSRFVFFVKQQLIWLPLIGWACWLMDFPFMRRDSKSVLAKHPEWRGRDRAITRAACARFQDSPVTVINYLEGTRATKEKIKRQGSPFQHLLRPRAGGAATVLSSMPWITDMIDITIVYPLGAPTFWMFCQGKVRSIDVYVEVVPVDDAWRGDYDNDPECRKRFQESLNALWVKKEERIKRARL